MTTAKRVPLTVYLAPAGFERVRELAAAEDRSDSAMARALIAEAVAARCKKVGTNPR